MYVLFHNNMPEEPEAKKQEPSNKTAYRSLFTCDPTAPNPHEFKAWTVERMASAFGQLSRM